MKPFRSSGVLISRVDDVSWRNPIVPRFANLKNPNILDLALDEFSEIAVHRLPDLVVGGESEAGVDDAGFRDKRCENRGRDVQIIDGTVANLTKQVSIGAELIGRKEIYLDASAGGFLDAVDGLA